MNTFFKQNNKRQNNEDTTFVIKDIDPKQLDRMYMMPELNNTKRLKQSLPLPPSNDNSLVLRTKTHNFAREKYENISLSASSKLDSIGLTNNSNNKNKQFPTIVTHNDINTKAVSQPICIVPNINIQTDQSNCWYCRLLIPTNVHSLSLPIDYKDETFVCEGIFCSFNCMVAHLFEIGNQYHRYKNSATYLVIMYQKMFGTHVSLKSIKPSPSWKLLRQYGGYMSNEDYRSKLKLNTHQSIQQTCKQTIKFEIAPEMFAVNE
jgi:hypothetical protein